MVWKRQSEGGSLQSFKSNLNLVMKRFENGVHLIIWKGKIE